MTHRLMERDEKHNTVCNVVGEAAWGFGWAMVAASTTLTLLLVRLGATERSVGLLPMVEALLLVMQPVGIYLFRNPRTRKRRLVIYHWLVVLPALGLIGVLALYRDRIPPGLLVAAIVVCWAWFMLTIGAIVAVWQDWLADLFHVRIRGWVTGLGWGAQALAGAAGALAAGRLIGVFPTIDTFAWLYIGGMAIGAVSIGVFLGMRDPAEHSAHGPPPTAGQMLGAAWQSLRDPHVRWLLAAKSTAVAGFCVGPYFTLYYRSAAGGGLSDSMLISLGAAQTLSAAFVNVGVGRLGDRIGHRWGVVTAAVAQVGALAVAMLVPGVIGCLIVMILVGLVVGGGSTSYLLLMIESCPHAVRSAHLAAGNIVVGMAVLLSPLLGRWIVEMHGIRPLLAASLVVSVMAVVVTALKVREPRHLVPSLVPLGAPVIGAANTATPGSS